METIYEPTRWNLAKLPGGINLEGFHHHLNHLKERISKVESEFLERTLKEKDMQAVSAIIKQLESAESLYYCFTVEDNLKRSLLDKLYTELTGLKSRIRALVCHFQEFVGSLDKQAFHDWSNTIRSKSMMGELLISETPEDQIMSHFSRTRLKGLEDIYSQLLRNLYISINETEYDLSFSDANQIAMSHPDRLKRKKAFESLNNALHLQSNIFAAVYHQMVQTRLEENRLKKTDFIFSSLKLNGISNCTLKEMWNTVDTNKVAFTSFLVSEAEEMGVDKLSWHEWKTASKVKETPSMSFSEAVENISEAVGEIDANMALFVKEAVAKNWIDAQERNSKPSGGFCAPFLPEGESRISLTYDGSMDSARRLAHELGHAWHFLQMEDRPSLRFAEDTFEMTIAECASIFFETAFINHFIQKTSDHVVKKSILCWKIEQAVHYLMSIRSAFLFERKLYELLKEGQLNADETEELSLQCQKEAYGNGLREYDPFLWIKYGQFYQADIPFYNYPYSFGYLLSIGLLGIANKNDQFKHMFQGFLSETGALPAEELFKKHFKQDISQPDFWQQSMETILHDIEEYKRL